MILKHKDPINRHLAQLEKIANLSKLPKEKRLQVDKEIKILKAGNQGEQDSAYFIDFHYKDSQDWIVIHDLRLKYQDLVAQIDHLLINRVLDCYVLETKYCTEGIKINEWGEFSMLSEQRYVSIESPIEQNKRHLKVLKGLLSSENLLPKRLGFSLQPDFFCYVLVPPKSRVMRPNPEQFNTDMVIKSDELFTKTEKNIENEGFMASMGSVVKVISQDMLKELGEKLIRYHRPTTPNYYHRFGIAQPATVEFPDSQFVTADPPISKPVLKSMPLKRTPFQPNLSPSTPSKPHSPQQTPAPSALNLPGPLNPNLSPSTPTNANSADYFCFHCKVSISRRVAIFCFTNKVRFGGRAYCFSCQKRFSSDSKS